MPYVLKEDTNAPNVCKLLISKDTTSSPSRTKRKTNAKFLNTVCWFLAKKNGTLANTISFFVLGQDRTIVLFNLEAADDEAPEDPNMATVSVKEPLASQMSKYRSANRKGGHESYLTLEQAICLRLRERCVISTPLATIWTLLTLTTAQHFLFYFSTCLCCGGFQVVVYFRLWVITDDV